MKCARADCKLLVWFAYVGQKYIHVRIRKIALHVPGVLRHCKVRKVHPITKGIKRRNNGQKMANQTRFVCRRETVNVRVLFFLGVFLCVFLCVRFSCVCGLFGVRMRVRMRVRVRVQVREKYGVCVSAATRTHTWVAHATCKKNHARKHTHTLAFTQHLPSSHPACTRHVLGMHANGGR